MPARAHSNSGIEPQGFAKMLQRLVRLARVQQRPALIGVGVGIVGPAGQRLAHRRRRGRAVAQLDQRLRPHVGAQTVLGIDRQALIRPPSSASRQRLLRRSNAAQEAEVVRRRTDPGEWLRESPPRFIEAIAARASPGPARNARTTGRAPGESPAGRARSPRRYCSSSLQAQRQQAVRQEVLRALRRAAAAARRPPRDTGPADRAASRAGSGVLFMPASDTSGCRRTSRLGWNRARGCGRWRTIPWSSA